MDVTCERCGTEYEFDETLVSARGTTVKCTNCGHLFKVFRPGSGPTPTADRMWRVRRRDGTEIDLGSLKELQRRITEGNLEQSDELSRSGESFKPLGDIAELKTFFAAAQATADESRPTSPRGERRDSTLSGMPVESSPFQRSPSSRPEPNRSPLATAPTQEAVIPPPARVPADLSGISAATAKETLFGVGQAPPSSRPPPPERAVPRRAAQPKPAPLPRPAPPAAAPEPPRSRPPAATAQERPGRAIKPTRPADEFQVATTEAESPLGGALRVDENDDIELPVRGGRNLGRWVALVVLAGLIGVGVWQWPTIAPRLGLGQDTGVERFLAAGDAALAQDDLDGYESAVREYTRATALAERDPRVLRALARTQSAWAQALAFQVSDLRAGANGDSEQLGEASALDHDRERQASAARRDAEDALRLEPGSAEAALLVADALRQTGDLTGAQRQLDRAGEAQREPTAEAHLVRALMAASSEAGLTAARSEAEAAVAADGTLLRARLLLARVHLAAGRPAEARAQLDAVLAARPGQPRAQRLIDAMTRGVPPAAPVVAILDGGAADATSAIAAADAGAPSVAPDPTTQVANQPAEHAPNDPGESSARAVPTGRDYGWYVSQADQRLESGDVGRARRFYQAALEVRPGSPEAETGLGFVALGSGNVSGAISHFQPAARAGYGDAYIGLGDAYRRLHREAAALTAYRNYLQRRPSGPQAAVARRHVTELSARLESTTTPTPPAPTGAAPSTSPEPGTSPDPRAATSPDPRAATPPDPRAATPPDPRAATPPDPRAATPPDPRAATPPDPRAGADPRALPAPRGTDPSAPPPSSDSLAIGNE